MIDIPITDEIQALLKREADAIIEELFEEQPDIDRDTAVKVTSERLTERVLLFHQIDEATR